MENESYYSIIVVAKKIAFILLLVSILLNIYFAFRLRKANRIILVTEAMLEEQQNRISDYISNNEKPNASEEKVFIHLTGAVNLPGVYSFDHPTRLFEVIERAGGEQASADLSALNLAEKIYDGTKIHIPEQGEIVKNVVSPPANSTANQDSNSIININVASMEQLESLEGIGKVKAKDILTYRKINGPFKKVEDIMLVKGIGPSTYDKIKSVIIAK